ncbi:MAG: hypothetical protein DI635_00330 [Pseudoxanthomonas suwonensis]|nr:MAG: hypothetical protein DI635_00330 [Pseudoxanthomonas suwonensis]
MASGTPELERFIHDALQQGHSRDAIQNALTQAGWSTRQTDDILGAYADVDFPLPVPKPRASLSARDAFLYLVLFATLYFTAYNFGSLLFDLINWWRSDPARAPYEVVQLGPSMRWAVAALIIAFPVFAWLAGFLAREVDRQPIKRLSPVRRWLTYLTLFVAAAILIGDMTMLVYNLLGGELTLRFVLKVAVVGLIAGTIFGYYLWDLRREEVRA